MTDIYQIRNGKDGMFCVFKNDAMLIYNLNSADVIEFSKLHKTFGSEIINETSASFYVKKSDTDWTPSQTGRRGRDLILLPHLDLIKEMVGENPKSTAKDIESRLKNLGVQFSSRTAIHNLARKYGIKLAA